MTRHIKTTSGVSVMFVGGGSGGHLTPLLAVANAVKRQNAHSRLIYIGQKGDVLREIMRTHVFDEQYLIHAGKYRRYHGEHVVRRLTDIRTFLLNVRDFFRFLHGMYDAWKILRSSRPDVILLKGGFVCVPVGLVARLRHIPYITHDSDSIPGLANRITGPHAVYNTTAMPAHLYPYDPRKTRQVGIPIVAEYHLVNPQDTKNARQTLDIPKDAEVVLVVGGGLGAQRINQSLVAQAGSLLHRRPNLYLIHITGVKNVDAITAKYKEHVTSSLRKRLRIIDFSNELYVVSAAADVVLLRAGATNIAEMAAQAKPCIVVPNPHLTGGHQLQNAKVLEDNKAAVVLYEDQLDTLHDVVNTVLDYTPQQRRELGEKLHTLSHHGAASTLAAMLLDTAGK